MLVERSIVSHQNWGQDLKRRDSSSSQQEQDRAHQITKHAVNLFRYTPLKNYITRAIIKEKAAYYRYSHETDGLRTVQSPDCLGFGKTKIAFSLSGICALMLPSLDIGPSEWQSVLKKEKTWSKFLNEKELLCLSPELIHLSLSKNFVEGVVEAYVTQTFESLAKELECFVIPLRDSTPSIWEKEGRVLFKTEEERLSERSWDSIIDPLLADLAKIAMIGGLQESAFNIAIVRQLTRKEDRYEVRFFGCGFSHSTPVPKKIANTPDVDSISEFLELVLTKLFANEFSQGVPQEFEVKLRTKYKMILRQKIESPIKAATKIQSCYRSWKVRLMYKKSKEVARNVELIRSRPGEVVDAKHCGMTCEEVHEVIYAITNKQFNEFERAFAEPHHYVIEEYFNGSVILPDWNSPENILLAKVNHKVIGFLITAKRKNEGPSYISCPADSGYLAYLAVDSEVKKSGMGTKLMLEAIIATKRLGKRYLTFDYLVKGPGIHAKEAKVRADFYNTVASRLGIPNHTFIKEDRIKSNVFCRYDLQDFDLQLVKN